MKNRLKYPIILVSLLLIVGSTVFLCKKNNPLVCEKEYNCSIYYPQKKGFLLEQIVMKKGTFHTEKTKKLMSKNSIGKTIGKKNGQYKDGRCSKKRYCIICNKEITGKKYCLACYSKVCLPYIGIKKGEKLTAKKYKVLCFYCGKLRVVSYATYREIVKGKKPHCPQCFSIFRSKAQTGMLQSKETREKRRQSMLGKNKGAANGRYLDGRTARRGNRKRKI